MSEYFDTSVVVKLHLACAINHKCDIFWSADKHHLKDKTKNYLKKYNIEVKSLKDIDL